MRPEFTDEVKQLRDQIQVINDKLTLLVWDELKAEARKYGVERACYVCEDGAGWLAAFGENDKLDHDEYRDGDRDYGDLSELADMYADCSGIFEELAYATYVHAELDFTTG